MKTKNILCYSQLEFDDIMKRNDWINNLPENISVISICSSDYGWHLFDDNWKTHPNVFNLDICDDGPYWFENFENECYDKALDLYNAGKLKESNAYFNNLEITVHVDTNKEYVEMVHVMDYEEAFDLVKWIETEINSSDTFYIHCGAGRSRSQAVVRYIRDIYGNDFDIKLNPNNPNDTYNPHVLLMLKRAHRELFENFK